MSEELNNENQITYFAQTNFRNQMRKFGIKKIDRRRHFYILGKTGSGKTTLMANLALQDIERGEGVAVLDPHGDVLDNLLDYIPSSRVNDVIYVSPADIEHPIAFNVLENVSQEYKHLVASGLMSVFKKIWANLWSARMEYILNNAILALLDSPGNTLLGIMRMLSDKNYRKKIVDKVSDPIVKTFWLNEFANYNDRFRQEAIAPIQNKVGQFLSSSIIRNIVGQPKSTIEPRRIMDDKKILLLDLSKGKIGEDNSNLLGAMFITKLWLAAMSRVNVPEEERKDFYLHVDEFQNFATESFADILSEARKYRLNLILAHQYIAQLVSNESTRVKDAVFGNVGTLVCFRVGAADARELIKEFEPLFLEEDLVNIGKYEIFLKLMIDGMISKPFTAKTLPPLSTGKKNDNREKIIRVSRERYSNPKAEVEDKIVRWSGVDEMFKQTGRQEKVSSAETVYKEDENKQDKDNKNLKNGGQTKKDVTVQLEAVCDNCGAETQLNFKPDLSKPIFCKDCLKEYRRGKIDDKKIKSKNEVLKNRLMSESKTTKDKKEIAEEKIETVADKAEPKAKMVVDEQKEKIDIKQTEEQKNNQQTKNNSDDGLVYKKEKTKLNLLVDGLADSKEQLLQKDGLSLNSLQSEDRLTSFRSKIRSNSGNDVKPGQVVKF